MKPNPLQAAYDRRKVLQMLLGSAAFAGGSSAVFGDAMRLTNNHFTYNGERYFRANAEEVHLAAAGEKREPVTGQNRLDVTLNLSEHIDVIVPTKESSYTFERSQAANIMGNINLQAVGLPASFSHDDFFDAFQAGELTFVHMTIDGINQRFRENLNADQSFIDFFKERNDYRICTSQIVVMKGSIANRLRAGHEGNFKLALLPSGSDDDGGNNSGGGQGKGGSKSKGKTKPTSKLSNPSSKQSAVKGKGKGSGSGKGKGKGKGSGLTDFIDVSSDIDIGSEEEYSIPEGSTFAYMLHKPEWNAQRKNRRTRITALRADQHGPS